MKVENKIIEIKKPQIELSNDEVDVLKQAAKIIQEIEQQIRQCGGTGLDTKYMPCYLSDIHGVGVMISTMVEKENKKVFISCSK